MLSILIVDDDPLLCAAMRRKIQIVDQGNGLGVQEVAAAHSVQEAWDLLRSRPINVLISDIQMPYRSGLDLVREVSRSRPEIQLVVLSGYDDYEYMRGALRCGVVDYLLKPVKLVQIQEVLLKCAENLRCQEESSPRQQPQTALGEWAKGLLEGKKEEPPCAFPHPVFWVAWSFGTGEDQGPQVLRGFCEENQPAGVALYPIETANGEGLLFLNTESRRQAPVKACLEACRAYSASRGVDIRFAVSCPFTSLEEYPTFYKEARYTMAYRLLEDFSIRFASPQWSAERSRLPRYQSRIHSAFQSRNFSGISEWLQRIFCPDFFQEEPFPEEIRSFYTYWVSQVQEMASGFHMELEPFPHFSRFGSLEAMREYLDGVLKQVEAASRVSTDKYAYILSTATEYVEKNFNREISMNEVAEKVSVSYTYFSRLFKEQMHQSFSEYVVSVRMREAKRLIQEDPSIKMKDVAALVGYESVYAFSRAFKQYFHVSPKQARA